MLRNRHRRPKTLRRAGCWLGLLCVCAAGAAADQVPADAVYGIWATSGTMIEITPDARGGLSGTIIALKHPEFREKDGLGVVGAPKTDLNNPDPALQNRPLLGLELFSDYRFHKGRWQGRLYVPVDGSNWKSRAFVKNGQLHVRAYAGLPLLGRTEKFSPISDCNPDVVRMIRVSGLDDTPCTQQLEDAE